jgi:hypothetical protein
MFCDAPTGTTERPLLTAELVVWLEVLAPLGLLTAAAEAPKKTNRICFH